VKLHVARPRSRRVPILLIIAAALIAGCAAPERPPLPIYLDGRTHSGDYVEVLLEDNGVGRAIGFPVDGSGVACDQAPLRAYSGELSWDYGSGGAYTVQIAGSSYAIHPVTSFGSSGWDKAVVYVCGPEGKIQGLLELGLEPAP
jgi:hypothetical protein